MAKREGDLVGAGVPVRDCVRDRGVKDMIGSSESKRAFGRSRARGQMEFKYFSYITQVTRTTKTVYKNVLTVRNAKFGSSKGRLQGACTGDIGEMRYPDPYDYITCRSPKYTFHL